MFVEGGFASRGNTAISTARRAEPSEISTLNLHWTQSTRNAATRSCPVAGRYRPARRPNVDHADQSAHQSVVVNVASSQNTSTEQLAETLHQYSDGNARLIVKYYTHAHRQASISFMLGIAFAVIGFAIFGAAAVSYLRNPDQVGGAIVAAVAGAVGFLFSSALTRREI
ncbi:hypothetical protein ABZ863_27155 [Saccharomonospora sp. NPDC046836]|uniref:TRADD-N-associated membrane domain-containing protein n=1 Tax=Saccharomonospora sp. NPDC046836 TaxID=3156921 RepID=UPI0033D763CE